MKGLKDNWALLLILAAVLWQGQATDYPGRLAYQLTGPATGVVEIEQHDTTPLDQVVRAITAEASGTITYRCIDGSIGETTVVAGQTIVAQIDLVYDTGTDLTDDDMTGWR